MRSREARKPVARRVWGFDVTGVPYALTMHSLGRALASAAAGGIDPAAQHLDEILAYRYVAAAFAMTQQRIAWFVYATPVDLRTHSAAMVEITNEAGALLMLNAHAFETPPISVRDMPEVRPIGANRRPIEAFPIAPFDIRHFIDVCWVDSHLVVAVRQPEDPLGSWVL